MTQPASAPYLLRSTIFSQSKKFFFAAGCTLIIIAVGLFFGEQNLQEERALALAGESLDRAESFLNEQKLKASTWTKKLAKDLNKASKAEALTKQSQYTNFWDGIQISLFDKNDKIITDTQNTSTETLTAFYKSKFENTLAADGDLQNLRKKAQVSGYEEAYAILDGAVYFVTISHPLDGAVTSIALAFPLDARLCKEISAVTRAQFILIAPKELSELAKELNIPAILDHEKFYTDCTILTSLISPKTLSSFQEPLGTGKTAFAVSLLKNASGSNAAGLITIPAPPPPDAMAYPIAFIFFALGILSIIYGLLKKYQDTLARSATTLYEHTTTTTPRRRATDKFMLQNDLITPAQLDVQTLMQSMLTQQAEQANKDYQRFFDTSPIGIFQCTHEGKFVQVNQTFAAMLGYDSALQMLAERSTFNEFCQNEDEIKQLLIHLKEEPNLRHPITFSLRNNACRSFWMVSIASCKADGIGSIDGFLLDTTQEQELEKCQHQRDTIIENNQSLALLLASTCKQLALYTQSTESTSDSTPASFREKQLEILENTFDDVCKVALAEADSHVIFSSPIDLLSLLATLQDEVAFLLDRQRIELSCSVDTAHVEFLNSFAPLLRHTLLRAVLFVTDNATEGKAHITVTAKEEDALKNTATLLFTISWENPDVQKMEEKDEAQNNTESTPGHENSNQRFRLSYAEEFQILQYLATRLGGKMVEATDTNSSRALYLTVTLNQGTNSRESKNTFTSSTMFEETDAMQDKACTQKTSSLNIPIDEESSSAFDLFMMDEKDINSASAPSEMIVGDEDGLDILLVEDSLNNRLLFSLYLRDTPHRITEAENGEEGVSLFQKKNFDVVFMDMEMPLMDGYQATRIIRAYEADTGKGHTPIVAQTAHVLPEFKSQCIQAGCTEFISKPFSQNTLLMMLTEFHEQRKEKEKHSL